MIDALRKRFSLNELIKALNISKSSYCYNAKVLSKDKYAEGRGCSRRTTAAAAIVGYIAFYAVPAQ